MAENTGKIIWLTGASGMVGAQVLEGLLQTPEFTRVIAITRRPLGRDSPRLANRIVPFGQIEAQLKGQGCDIAMCCLGSSLKEAGSEAAYREAVQVNVLAFARAAKAAGAKRFIVLSCFTADKKSRRVTDRILGETLDSLLTPAFDSLDIFQPGPLLGLRRGAGLSQLLSLSSALILRLTQFGARGSGRAVSVAQLATAMIAAARSGRRGVYRYDYSGILSLSRMRGRT